MNQTTEGLKEHQPVAQPSQNCGQTAPIEPESVEKPTEAQKRYIADLGRRVGLWINVERIASRESALRTIRCLRLLDMRMNTSGRLSPLHSRPSVTHERLITTHIKGTLNAMRG